MAHIIYYISFQITISKYDYRGSKHPDCRQVLYPVIVMISCDPAIYFIFYIYIHTKVFRNIFRSKCLGSNVQKIENKIYIDNYILNIIKLILRGYSKL